MATYNERENLGPLSADILATLPAAEILVIDDASPDGTGKLADELAAADPRIHVLHRSGKLGLGTAVTAAMKYAVEHGYDFLVNMDADFSHSPKHLPDLVAGMDKVDVMIGSRYVPGGGVVDWGWIRPWMSWGINTYARLLLGLTARDTSGAYRCYRVAKLAEIDFGDVYSRGYSFQEEILFHVQRTGATVGETPIVFENRRHGKSKIDRREVVTALWALLYVAWRFGPLPRRLRSP
ncbi:MAG: polyprenol monophosphomannose synthase [Planctomycetia bacterium]